jgi:hypothetical protein
MRKLTVKPKMLLGASLAMAALILAACGGGGGSSGSGAGQAVYKQIPVPGVTSANQYSFDLGTVDAA